MIELSAVCLSYLLGSIPTGLIAGWLKGVDVRQHGSGNVGATNVARVAGKLPGLLVLLVDAAKGWAPVALIAPKVVGLGSALPLDSLRILLGVAAVSGHIWNPFLQFQGGKGVATATGVLIGLDWRVALGSFAVWLIAAVWSRYVSVASISAALAAPFLMLLSGAPILWVFGCIGVSMAILWRHRPNILRLLQREEHRIGSARR
jgi:glycerol-3-phosphate acyltransferase PlsY